MSYWFRNGDGSCSYGSINLGRPNDPSEYLIKFPDAINKREDDVINNIDFSQYTKNDVYVFLYGHTEKEIVTLVNTRQRKMPDLKQWNSNTVRNIDVNLFLVTLLVFIDSKSDFSSKLWKTIKTIFLLILEQDLPFFEDIALFHDYSPQDFFYWFDGFVSNELSNKVLEDLNEEHCFWCYTSLCAVKDVIAPKIYDELERLCCGFFDKIALQRINNKISLPRNLDELFTYSIDNLFFYNDYFELKHANPKTIEIVNEKATFLYTEIAKILIKHKYYLQAQNFLEDAKKIYVTKSQLTEIIEIEYSIKRPVERLRRKQKAKEARIEKKKYTERLKKIKKLYRSINKKLVKFLLPNKIKQLECIMKSMFVLIGQKTDYTHYYLDYQKNIFSVYADAVVRLTLNPSDMRSVIFALKNKHSSVLKTDALAATVVAFASSNMINNQFEIVTDEDLSLMQEIGKDLLENETPKNDAEVGGHHLKDSEYGLVVTKPIYTTGVKASYAYLRHLASLSGERYTWERLGSTSTKEVNGMIDMYKGTLPSGETSPIVYINMYGSEDSHSAPIGFMYID